MFMTNISKYQEMAANLQDQMKQLQVEKRAEAKALRESNEWKEVAEQMVGAAKMIVAGIIGVKRGVFPQTVELAKTDWGARLDRDMRTLSEDYDNLQDTLAEKYKTTIKGVEASEKGIEKLEEGADKALARAEDTAFKKHAIEADRINKLNAREQQAAIMNFNKDLQVASKQMDAQNRERIAKLNISINAAKIAAKTGDKDAANRLKEVAKLPSEEKIGAVLEAAASGDEKAEKKARYELAGIVAALDGDMDSIDEIVDMYKGSSGFLGIGGTAPAKENVMAGLRSLRLAKKDAILGADQTEIAPTEAPITGEEDL